jgi:hypothetical protein
MVACSRRNFFGGSLISNEQLSKRNEQAARFSFVFFSRASNIRRGPFGSLIIAKFNFGHWSKPGLANIFEVQYFVGI